MTKEEILKRMDEEMPWGLNDKVFPYIEEAMQIYADQELSELQAKYKEQKYINYGKETYISILEKENASIAEQAVKIGELAKINANLCKDWKVKYYKPLSDYESLQHEKDPYKDLLLHDSLEIQKKKYDKLKEVYKDAVSNLALAFVDLGGNEEETKEYWLTKAGLTD